MLVHISHAAFGTVYHTILLYCLEHRVELRHTVLNWISSYHSNRPFLVSVGDFKWERASIPYGVPQGLILGPLLYDLWMLLLCPIIQQYQQCHTIPMLTTQLFVSVSSSSCVRLWNATPCSIRYLEVTHTHLPRDKGIITWTIWSSCSKVTGDILFNIDPQPIAGVTGLSDLCCTSGAHTHTLLHHCVHSSITYSLTCTSEVTKWCHK